jgi:hypothetical protein
MDIPVGSEPYLDVTLVYPGANGKEQQASGEGSSRSGAAFAVAAHARSDAVSVMYESVSMAVAKPQQQADAQEKMRVLGERISTLETAGGAWVTQLKADVKGRASKALLGQDRFNRWGKHYLLAFTRAHQVQYCTNFMDKSLQEYGGALFRALREEGDGVFVSLPPPTPSAKKTQTVAAARRSSAPAATYSAPAPDMSVYYGGSGGG